MTASAIALIFVLFATVGLLLETIDQFVDKDDKLRIKERIEDLWLFVATLSTPESVSLAVRARRQRMTKKYIPLFIKSYWIALFILLATICFENYRMDIKTIKLTFTNNIDLDFTIQENLAYRLVSDSSINDCSGANAQCSTTPKWLRNVSRLAASEQSFNNIVDNMAVDEPNVLKLVSDVSYALAISALGIFFTIALLISFYMTNYILAIVTKSKLKLVIIVFLDIALSLAITPLIYSVFTVVISYLSIMATMFRVVEFSTFESANIFNLIVAQASVSIISGSGIAIFASSLWLLMSIILFAAGIANITWFLQFLLLQCFMIYSAVYDRIVIFFVDTWRVINLDYNVDFITSAVNWAIFIDLLYSMFFLVPAIVCVLIQRWSFGRRVFLNVVLSVAEHPRGVIYAFGEMLLGVVAAVRRLFIGK